MPDRDRLKRIGKILIGVVALAISGSVLAIWITGGDIPPQGVVDAVELAVDGLESLNEGLALLLV